MHTIEIEHLAKRYGDRTVVDDLSFTVEPGRVTGFLGPNGSGKSTTMKMMLDLASADRGRATIDGQRYRDLADPARTVGAMIESDAFHPGRSGRNHLRVLADATGIPQRRVDEVLDEVGLADAANRQAGAYSLGMRQRLGLAGALLGSPPVLVLDEPGNGLDPEGIRTLRDQLRAHAAAGGTVFVSSHLLAEVEHLADDVIVINAGRLVTQGPLAELQQAASLVRTPDAVRLAVALEQAGATTELRDPDSLVVRDMAIDEIGEPRVRSRLRPPRTLTPGRFTRRAVPHLDRIRIRPGGQPVMTIRRLIRSELRKLTTTKMPWAFLAVLVVLAGINAFAVIAGTDFDGSKAFISTAADQQSLMAFAANAFAIAGLFGAIAVAREYGHHTVVPTFLAAPRRARAVLAQLDRDRPQRWSPRAGWRRAHCRRGRRVVAGHRLRVPRVGRRGDPGARCVCVLRRCRRCPGRRHRLPGAKRRWCGHRDGPDAVHRTTTRRAARPRLRIVDAQRPRHGAHGRRD